VDGGDIKRINKLNIWLAVVFWIEFYTYPFCWTATIVLYFLSIFFLSVKEKRFFHWRGFLLFLAIIAAVAVPYVLNLKMAALDPSYLDSNLRFGFMDTRIPSAYFNVGLAVLGLMMLFFSRKYFNDKKQFIFLSSLGLGGIIVNWQNVITGKALSFSMHYYWVVVLFMFLIIAGIWNAIKKEKFSLRIFFVLVLMILSIAVVIDREKGGIKFGLSGWLDPVDIGILRDRQSMAPLADWLNNNTPKDSVIYYSGNGDYGWFLPIYTHNNVYYNGNITAYLMSDSEIEDRWIVQNFFTDLTVGHVKDNQGGIWMNKFIEPYQNREIRKKIVSLMTGREYAPGIMMPDGYALEVIDRQAVFRELGFEKALKKYVVDYILVSKKDPDQKKVFDPESFSFLSLIGTIGDNLIYKVR
jgi:hypothetical protein